jgi:HTH-type transcriptional regulator, competence development regulator
MKLNLGKEWFEKRIPRDENYEVGAGVHIEEALEPAPPRSRHDEDEFAEAYAIGKLVQFLRRERNLSVEELAAQSRIATTDLLSIELEPEYVPNARTIHQLADFFGLPQRPLLKLSNITTVHNDKLREGAIRFAASAPSLAKLNREERAALADFVHVLKEQTED